MEPVEAVELARLAERGWSPGDWGDPGTRRAAGMAPSLLTAEALSAPALAQTLRKDKPHPDDKEVPVRSFLDDLQRKTSLRKVMGPKDKNPFTDEEEQEDPENAGADDLEPEPEQFTKEETNYRYSGVPDRSCGVCRYYEDPGGCQLVAGLIRPVDVCDLFEPREEGAEGMHQPKTARAQLAEVVVEAELAEHKLDPSTGKWVPTPGEGGPGAAPGPRKHAKVRDPRAQDSSQARREMRDPIYRNKLGFIDDISRKHGDAVADQAAGILGMPDDSDRFYDRWEPKKPERMSDMNSNALRIIRDEASRRGYAKTAGTIDKYLKKRKPGMLAEGEQDVSGDFAEHVQDPSGKWVPTPGEGGPGATPSPQRKPRLRRAMPFGIGKGRGKSWKADVYRSLGMQPVKGQPGRWESEADPSYPGSGGMNLGGLVSPVRVQIPGGLGMRTVRAQLAESGPARCHEAHCFEHYIEVTPPGFEKVVKSLKKEPGVRSPWAVAWAMRKKGIAPKDSEGRAVSFPGGKRIHFEPGKAEGEVSPPGWEGTVKHMKRHPEITTPHALAWWMKGKGFEPGRGPRGGKKTVVRAVLAEVVY